MKLAGVFSKNREEWLIFDMACNLYGITTVPFYDTLGFETISFMLDQTNLTTIFCDKGGVEKILKT